MNTSDQHTRPGGESLHGPKHPIPKLLEEIEDLFTDDTPIKPPSPPKKPFESVPKAKAFTHPTHHPHPSTQATAHHTSNNTMNPAKLMAWSGGIIFILAALYFFKLVYDAGWLTPFRQVMLGYLSAVLLITSGFFLHKKDQHYAAYLPAVALVVLHLATFFAHLVYHLIPSLSALILVAITSLLGIWLGRYYKKTVYMILSALGVYISPMLVHAQYEHLLNLMLYYSVWNLFFSFCALQEERRLTYLLPAYLAILSFTVEVDLNFRTEWMQAALFQFIQFLIFSVTTVVFSIKKRLPIKEDEAFSHGIILILFYYIEYVFLKENHPALANYVSLASGAVVFGFYAVGRHYIKSTQTMQNGTQIVSCYYALVIVHAIFFGMMGNSWLPWAGLGFALVYLLLGKSAFKHLDVLLPMHFVFAAVFLGGYFMLINIRFSRFSLEITLQTLALFLYAISLYGAYWRCRKIPEIATNSFILLYVGHFTLLCVEPSWITHSIYLSAIWAFCGVALLSLAIKVRDKMLGRSALLFFAAAAGKVLLFDLSDSNSFARVLALITMSASLYVGGWLYQSLNKKNKLGK